MLVQTRAGRLRIYRLVLESFGSAAFASRPVIASLEIHVDDGDLEFSGLQVLPVWAWEDVRGHSKKVIDESGTTRCYESHVLPFRRGGSLCCGVIRD
jgi:hypothetical protein